MELVGEGTAWSSVSGDQSLHGFHRNFGPAVCMGVVCRRYSMVHSPVGQEGLVVWEANSGPPSDVSVSGIPKVQNVSLSVWVRPVAPSLDVLTTGQLEKRSTRTR